MENITSDPLWQQIRQGGLLGGRRVHYFEAVESTNTLALAMGRAGEPAGTVLVAETQTQGRGRLGKSWTSPPGTGLYCTLLLRPAIPLPHLARITLAVGLAAALAIDEVSGLVSAIKWPNDVQLQGRKVAGILAECEMSAEGGWPLVAIGVGINLSTGLAQFPPELQAKATSLLIASGQLISKGAMLVTLLRRIEQMVGRMEQDDFAGVLKDWRAKDATAEQWLSWLADDGRVVYGMSLGPNQDGQLVIRDETGLCHQIISGDISLDPNGLNGYVP